MNILFLVVGISILFVIAYKTYGTFLAKNVYELNDENKVPSVEMEDGMDYVPTEPSLLLGQHFSAIAAAGPVTGPILAGIAYGWIPTTLWIFFGSIFVGGVHDWGAMVASVRNKGRSITETVRTNIGTSAWILFNIFIYVALVFIIVAFTDITSSAFVNTIEVANGEKVGGPAIAMSSLLYLILPVIMGFLLKYTKLSLTWATVIFLPLVGVAIWIGKYIPFDLQAMLGLATPAAAGKVWNAIIIIYCIIAGVVPVWALLQPRGHLGGYFMYASIVVAAIGVLFGGFKATYPAFNIPKGGSTFFPMFPMLFITVACGACSGFHSLVSSGTTSKQIKRESDTKLIGYGGMLMEGVVAAIALSTVMILAKDNPLLGKSPNFIYANGLGAFMALIGVSPAFGISFGLMAFTTFVYDTLDVCVRLGRFIFTELTGMHGWAGKILGTVLTGGIPVILMSITLHDAEGKVVEPWRVFWTTFGASNQLLAALALIGITVWLLNSAKNKNAWKFTFWPAVWMFVMSSWGLIRMFWTYTSKAGAWVGFPSGANVIVPVVCLVYLFLAIWMAFEAVKVLNRKLSGKAAPATGTD